MAAAATICPRSRWWLRRRWLLIPMLLVLVFALPQLFGGKMRVDSGLYAGVSLHMYNQGTFWTPMAGDAPYFRKPPLVFWIHGAFLWLLGPHLWVMRLPTVIAALGIVGLTCLIARRMTNWRVALFSGCVLATTVSFFHLFQRFVLDYWQTFFMLVGVWMIVEAQRRRLLWLAICAGAPIGASMLCKPLISGIALPIMCVWLATIREYRWALLTFLGGTVTALMVAAPWHLSMIAQHGDLFLGSYFQREMVDRVTTAQGFEAEPWYWYLIELAKGYWPWMLTLVLGLWTWARTGPGSERETRFRRLCVAFCLLWLAIMMYSADKRIRYLMPMLPMLSMISGWWLAHITWGSRRRLARRRTLRWLEMAVQFAVVAAAIFATLPIHYNTQAVPEWEALDQYIRDHPGERYQIGTVNVQDGGRIYFYTGIWPHNAVDPVGRELPIEPNTLLINSHEVPRTRRIQGEVVFDQGKLQIVRVK